MSTSFLRYPDVKGSEFKRNMDVNNGTIGAVLSHIQDGQEVFSLLLKCVTVLPERKYLQKCILSNSIDENSC